RSAPTARGSRWGERAEVDARPLETRIMADPEPNANSRSEETVFLDRQGFAAPTPEALGARIPNLEVHELVGQGGMGGGYRGRQPLLDRPVAIKVLRPDVRADSTFQDRFLREARTLAKLRHPYVVTVHDVGRVDDLYYLVMEYVEGESLRQMLERGAIGE